MAKQTFYITETCGYHFDIDIPDDVSDPDEIRELVAEAWVQVEDINDYFTECTDRRIDGHLAP